MPRKPGKLLVAEAHPRVPVFLQLPKTEAVWAFRV